MQKEVFKFFEPKVLLEGYKNHDKSRISVLKSDNSELISDGHEKAETSNNVLSNCFITSASQLTEKDRDLFVTTSPDCPPELSCTEDDILELLLSQDTTKANGPDDISVVMLKATAPTITKGVKINLYNLERQ